MGVLAAGQALPGAGSCLSQSPETNTRTRQSRHGEYGTRKPCAGSRVMMMIVIMMMMTVAMGRVFIMYVPCASRFTCLVSFNRYDAFGWALLLPLV